MKYSTKVYGLAKVAHIVVTEDEKWNTFNHFKFLLFLNTNIISTIFQLIRDSFYPFDWEKKVFKDNVVKKYVRMGQSFMIINIFFP